MPFSSVQSITPEANVNSENRFIIQSEAKPQISEQISQFQFHQRLQFQLPEQLQQPPQPPQLSLPQHQLQHFQPRQYQPRQNLPQPLVVKEENPVAFDEEYLVSLDSETFQNYVHQLRQRRILTSNEEVIVKRLVKKIKNRESARKSRQAKKEVSQELDEQVQRLIQQTQSLKLEASSLYAINQQIKNEISFSEKLIASNPYLSKLYAKTWSDLQNMTKSGEDNISPNTTQRCTPVSFTNTTNNNGVVVNS